MMLVNTIYQSISGEVGGPRFPQGSWCTFLRFQGCSLRCSYCDTPQALSRKNPDAVEMTPNEIFIKLLETGNRKVLITGGEPLEQPKDEMLTLLRKLVGSGFIIQLETAGYIPLMTNVPNSNLYWIVDQKGPSSRMEAHNIPVDAMAGMIDAVGTDKVVLKYVIASPEDLDWAIDRVQQYSSRPRMFSVTHAFSPVDGSPGGVPRMIEGVTKKLKMHHFNFVISVQMHKLVEMP